MTITPVMEAARGQPGKFVSSMVAKVLPLMPIQLMADSASSREKMLEPFLPKAVRDKNAVEKPVSKEIIPVITATKIRKASAARIAIMALAKVIRKPMAAPVTKFDKAMG